MQRDLPTRRRFIGAALGALVAGVAGYSGLIEPNQVRTESLRLVLPRLPEAFHGARIVQVSDLHYGPYTGPREIRRAVEAASSLHADIAITTGDFVTAHLYGHGIGKQMANAADCARILSGIRAPLGSFACLGNHDVSVDPHGIAEIVRGQGIRLLRNASVAVERDGARLWIGGVDDALYAHADLDRTLGPVPQSEFTLLMAHEPDFADRVRSYPVDLQLSGHSHGGQVGLPLVGAPYYPPMSRKYPRGLYRVGNLHLYTNRGIGTIGVPLRLFSPPEVTLFTLLSH